MLVYVINKFNKPLMPCSSRKARILLRDKKARVFSTCPFTIKLLYGCTSYIQKLDCGIDMGSKVIGSAVRTQNNESMYFSEITVRQDIKSKLDQRRMYRRNRRVRKTRYRKARFLNRRNSIKKDRYSPTIKSKFQSLVKELWFIFKRLPIYKLKIEIASFDPHYMHNKNVKKYPWLYQKGIQLGFYNVREYVKSRDNYTCQYCKGKSKDKILHVHHIIPRSNQGSDRPNNLICLCETCHNKVHNNQIILNKKVLKSTLNHATHMNTLCSLVKKKIPYAFFHYGYETKAIREHFNIQKTHCFDAICIGVENNMPFKLLQNKIIYKRCLPKGRYQLTNGIRSEKKLPSGKICGFKTNDKVLYENKIVFIKGKMSTGYTILSNIFGDKINFNHIPKFKKMKRISAQKTWIMIEGIIPNT